MPSKRGLASASKAPRERVARMGGKARGKHRGGMRGGMGGFGM